MGPATARKIFSTLLSGEVLGLGWPNVEVTVIPEDGAVDRILNLPRLQILAIHITRPNEDASSPEARRRVFSELDDVNAQTLDIKLTKTSGSTRLEPNGNYEELAKIAADTGYVRGEERDEDGKKFALSTKELPKRLYVENTPGKSFIARVLSVLS